jgi:hypothetical protein
MMIDFLQIFRIKMPGIIQRSFNLVIQINLLKRLTILDISPIVYIIISTFELFLANWTGCCYSNMFWFYSKPWNNSKVKCFYEKINLFGSMHAENNSCCY